MPEEPHLESILVVDDNEANRYTLSRILRREGFTVREAVDGLEGLRMAAQPPDLFILDVRMPGLDGHELVRRLKANPVTSPIPILQISATYTSPTDIAYGLQTGADGYLTHPVDPGVLVATVRAFLRARKAELQVQTAAREWRATFDALTDGVCLLDREGKIIRCNLAFARSLGRHFPELVGASLEDLLPQLRDSGFAASGTPGLDRVHGVVPYSESWFRLTIDPARDEMGKVWGAVVSLGDVTDARHAELALRESEERFRTLVTSFGSLVWSADSRGVPIFPPVGWEEATGQDEQHFRDEGWAGVCHPEDLSSLQASWRRSVLTSAPFEHECRLRRRDGGYAVVRWAAVPITGPVGEVREWIGTITDVSARRAAEEQVQRIQRTETIGRLAGGIAHETNNQMTVVLGFTDFVLAADNLTDSQRKDLRQVRDAAQRVAYLTRQLLAFSRRLVLRTEVVDLNTAVTEANAMLARVLGPDIDLLVDLAPEALWVRVDRTQLIQILLNLGLNAREAMPRGGPIRITTRHVENPPAGGILGRHVPTGDFAMLSLADTGVGIDPAIRPQIFDPFFSTKPVGEGSGMGLSVVEGIVEQSGGEIWLESRPGKGTVVTIGFPLVEPGEQVAVPEPSAAQRIGNATVLLVDDEDSVRDLFLRGLAQAGCRTYSAENGLDALTLMEDLDGQVDLVVTDLAMPHLGGAALAREIGTRWPGTRILFMSGHSREIATQREELDPQAAFLQKPFSLDTLLDAIGKTLETNEKEGQDIPYQRRIESR